MSDIRALVREELATPVDPRAAAMAAAIASRCALVIRPAFNPASASARFG